MPAKVLAGLESLMLLDHHGAVRVDTAPPRSNKVAELAQEVPPEVLERRVRRPPLAQLPRARALGLGLGRELPALPLLVILHEPQVGQRDVPGVVDVNRLVQDLLHTQIPSPGPDALAEDLLVHGLALASADLLQQISGALEVLHAPLPELHPQRSRGTINLLQRDLPGAISVQVAKDGLCVTSEIQPQHAHVKLSETDLLVVVAVKVPQPRPQGVALHGLQEGLDLILDLRGGNRLGGRLFQPHAY
mmetsp:Transcript_4466/g.13039  ORF Transcript_4466/g.13039 Transcript_4466/m.13039 type:complete len:247 (+) Transcript_4466:2538-3278(+)